ncbi:N-6 DNA methylase [Nocardia nepalensis]|uniref:HsdM family class I SAM-dependent methyltransferase n=1 Tax=Nocardia nepalensis TaxID=3375448 RepID=UPI003B66E786
MSEGLDVTASVASDLATELWNYRKALGDSGMSTLEYVEQLSLLLFLKIAKEIRDASFDDNPSGGDAARAWNTLVTKRGDELERQYRSVLGELAKSVGTTVGTVFAKSQNRITEPATLEKLIIDLIGGRQWGSLGTEVNGDIFEGLLAKSVGENPEAGNFLTPRPLIETIVDVMRPQPTDTIFDPACGSGGFLIAAYEYLLMNHRELMTNEQLSKLNIGTIQGVEVLERRARLAAMNMLLHGIGRVDGPALVDVRDVLATEPGHRPSLVMVNPPFGNSSSVPGSDGSAEPEGKSYDRIGFISTPNKQLNFVQHVMSLLSINGRAAVVVPDNVLFEGGAGERIRRRLLRSFDVHTLLRLPKGIFFKAGVRANVLFFDKRSPRADGKPLTDRLWVYDFRTDQHFTRKTKPLRRADLDDFVSSFRAGEEMEKRGRSERFRDFTFDELVARDNVSFDITWLADNADVESRLSPGMIAREILDELQAACEEFSVIADALDDAVQGPVDPGQTEFVTE